MIIYNLLTKQKQTTLQNDNQCVLLDFHELKSLPFITQGIHTQMESTRPLIHFKDFHVYSFKTYQDDLQATQAYLIHKGSSYYLVVEDVEVLDEAIQDILPQAQFMTELIKYFLDYFYTIFSNYEDKLINLEVSLSSGSFENVSLDSLSKMKHDAMMAEKNMRRIQYIILNADEENMQHLHPLVMNNTDYTRHLVDYINHLLNLYNSLIQERTNNSLNKLSMLAFLATPVTIISGIYGMNFINMPLTQHKYGFYITIVITAFLMWIIYLIIRQLIDKKEHD